MSTRVPGRLFFGMRRVDILALILLFMIAGYLRLGRPGIVEYKRDEANLSQLALEMAHGDSLPLLGIGSSVGFPNAPVNVYVLAVPYFFSNSPQLATQFVTFLNVLAVLMTYGLARRYCNPFIAFTVTLLFAVSPWSLIFSRKIWAQNMLPPFIIGVVVTGIMGFLEGKRWGQWLHVPLLVIVGQIHYAAFVIVPTSIYLIWVGRRNITRAFWLSFIPAMVLLLPYVIGLQQADLLSPETMREALARVSEENIGDTEKQHSVSLVAIEGAGILISGTQIHSLAGSERFLDYLETVPDAYPVFNVLAWMLVAATLWLTYSSVFRADERTPVDVALLLWLIFPILAFSFSWTPFFIHYLIPIFPAAFLIIGFALHDAYSALKSSQSYSLIYVSSATMGLFVSVVIVLQVILWMRLLNFLDKEYTPGGFGTPLHDLLDVREAILDRSETHVIGDVGGQAIGFDGEPSVWHTLLYSVDHVRFQDANTEVFPAEESAFFTRECNSNGLENAETYLLRSADEGCYIIGERDGRDLDLDQYVAIDRNVSYRFTNGVELLAYQWDMAQQCLQLVWEITQTTQQDYMFAIHFFDSNGNGVGNADGLSWFGRYWLPGDRVVRTFCLPQSSENIAEVHIGMYTYDGVNFNNVDLLDENGVPDGQSYRLPLTSES